MGKCFSKQPKIVEIHNDIPIVHEIPLTVLEPDEKKKEEEKLAKISYHSRKMSNHYIVNYPDHPKRTESALYRQTRKKLKFMPCFICDRVNVEGEQSNEIHHFYIEKVAASAIDWIKFGEFAQECFHLQTGENIGKKFDWKEVEKNPEIFVDSPENMIVLCKKHHTGRIGIHHVPFPDWILQKFAVKDFQFVEGET